MTTILAFLFVLGVLVFVHELGHFVAARRIGVNRGVYYIVVQLLGSGRRHEFVPQAVVDGELGRELPIVLRIEIVRVKAEMSLRGS